MLGGGGKFSAVFFTNPFTGVSEARYDSPSTQNSLCLRDRFSGQATPTSSSRCREKIQHARPRACYLTVIFCPLLEGTQETQSIAVKTNQSITRRARRTNLILCTRLMGVCVCSRIFAVCLWRCLEPVSLLTPPPGPVTAQEPCPVCLTCHGGQGAGRPEILAWTSVRRCAPHKAETSLTGAGRLRGLPGNARGPSLWSATAAWGVGVGAPHRQGGEACVASAWPWFPSAPGRS